MVGALLSLAEPPEPDHAADALAVAICHANGAPLRRRRVRRSDRLRPRRGASRAAPDEVVIEAAGVGYRLAVSSETLSAVPAAGEQAPPAHATWSCATTRMHLYGFATEAERELFLMLIGGAGRRARRWRWRCCRAARRASC